MCHLLYEGRHIWITSIDLHLLHVVTLSFINYYCLIPWWNSTSLSHIVLKEQKWLTSQCKQGTRVFHRSLNPKLLFVFIQSRLLYWWFLLQISVINNMLKVTYLFKTTSFWICLFIDSICWHITFTNATFTSIKPQI